MSSPAEQTNARYTWDDYRTWWDDKRWEIIGGEVYDMTPAPLVRHQWIAGRLFSRLVAVAKQLLIGHARGHRDRGGYRGRSYAG